MSSGKITISAQVLHHAAICAFVVGAAVPYHLESPFAAVSTISFLDIALCLTAPYALAHLLYTQFPRIARSILFLLSIPMLACLLSLTWSDDSSRTMKGVAGYSEAICAFFVAYTLFSALRPRAILFYSALFTLLLIIPALGSQLEISWFEPQILDSVTRGSSEYVNLKASYDSRLSHPFIGLHNDFATVLSLFVPILLAGSRALQSKLLLLHGLICSAACALTQSRGVLGAVVFSLMGLLFTNRHLIARRNFIRTLITAGFATTLLGGLVMIYFSYSEPIRTHFASRFSNDALIVRAERFELARDFISDQPLLGVGGNVVPSANLGNLHNTYLEQIVYFGLILGPLCDIALLSIPWVLWRFIRRGTLSPLIASAVVWTIIAQLISFAGETSFEAYLPKTYVYLATGLFVALLCSIKSRPPAWIHQSAA